MSLKRKGAPTPSNGLQKKPKTDFFAPRTSAQTAGAKTAFTFKANAPNTTRLVTWNVNGVKSLDEKLLDRYLKAEEPSVIILTETRCSEGKPDIFSLKSRFKYQYWGTGPQHAGIAILSKLKPLSTVIGLPTCKDPSTKTEGRYIQIEFDKVYVVGTYAPNSGDKLQALDMKREWNAALTAHLRALDSMKPVIWAGDFNCIPTKLDADDTALAYWDKMGGMSPEERADFEEILNPSSGEHAKFADAWRHLRPSAQEYTHGSKKFGAWRLDSFIMSERILDKALCCDIRHELKDLKLSDHWPITIDVAELLP
ncbi:putative DNA-(apurinic or apyrimidinic site) lyase [Lyophyllum shimeji]|uniref:DNA-(Apurinic or apyrimidinic site) lyase n=1 Tax=Lyophyllum shimeji TaxID=47721 RepID=A0A9P3UIV1_LYOSH|nr:putative DNA-(apurinic or apyrimidinic site) lyase [Lyophyllum shimeji]